MSDQIPVILIADDDPDLRTLVRAYLESAQCVIHEANNGQQALETVMVEHPDLVVLDVMMPKMTGWEVLRDIRSNPDLADTGILMLTGIGASLNELSSPMYGADDYIDKPFREAELLVKVRRILSKRRRAKNAEQQNTEG